MDYKKFLSKLFKSREEYKFIKRVDRFKKDKEIYENKYKNILNETYNNIKNKKTLNFLHSGHCGDLIYSLATIKDLSKNHTCNFYINVNKKNFQSFDISTSYKNHPSGDVYISEKMSNIFLPLLKNQKYLNKVEKYSDQAVDVNLDLFRELPINLCFNSPRWYFHITGSQVDLSKPYLDVSEHSTIKDKIIIHRTFRYRNNFINYKFLNNFDNLLFVGMKNEYDDLKKDIPNLEIYDCRDFLEMAQIIKSSKLFIGNMSVAYPIAEALKVPRLLEGCPYFPIVQPIGENAYDFYFQEHFENYFKILNHK